MWKEEAIIRKAEERTRLTSWRGLMLLGAVERRGAVGCDAISCLNRE